MPTYCYRCDDCDGVTEVLASIRAIPASVECSHCHAKSTHQIIAGSAYHASETSKTARLDPKYDKMVDSAMRRSANADPNRLLARMKPFPKT